MENVIIEQFVLLSRQIGELEGTLRTEMKEGFKNLESKLRAEMQEGFKAQDEKIETIKNSLSIKMNDGFRQLEYKIEKLDEKLEENAIDTANIFNDIFRQMASKTK